MKIEDIQHGGDHYKGQPKHLQPIWLATALGLNPMEYSILKYLLRHRRKGGIEDLEKMMHFGQMLIEQEYGVETELVYVDEELAVQCEQSSDTPQLFDCPFTAGDMVCPKLQPDDHWYICAVMADSMLLQKPGRNEDFTVAAIYYDRWQLCTGVAEQPAECPFAVGDVIRSIANPDALGWRIERVLEDKMEAVSDDGYKTPADILREEWCRFAIISKSSCPFKAGDVIRSIRWPNYVFRIINIRADDMTVHEERTGGRHRIPRCNWGAYTVKSVTAVDKPDATC